MTGRPASHTARGTAAAPPTASSSSAPRLVLRARSSDTATMLVSVREGRGGEGRGGEGEGRGGEGRGGEGRGGNT